MINIYSEIKDRIKMKDILSYYGIMPVRGTNIYKCPFHQDKRPSANIIKNSDIFNCFSCHWHGDIYDVVEYFEHTDRSTTIKLLDERYKLGLVHNLTKQEREELKIAEEKRKKEKIEKQIEYEKEKQILNTIVDKINFWREAQTLSHITRGEYRRGDWEMADVFFTSIIEQDRLEWLYLAICGLNPEECDYTYIYGNDKKKIINKIELGEILI